MKYPDIVSELSKELDIPEEVVSYAYKSFYKFIRESIKQLPLKEDLTEEQFNELRTNFNIPALGKLHCTYDRYLGIKERGKYIKGIKTKI